MAHQIGQQLTLNLSLINQTRPWICFVSWHRLSESTLHAQRRRLRNRQQLGRPIDLDEFRSSHSWFFPSVWFRLIL
jgi:hypothetical protein